MLVIVNTETGAKVHDVDRGIALWSDGAMTHAPKVGLIRGAERIVECVEAMTGEGPIEEVTGEAFDGEAWVVTRTRSHPPLVESGAIKKEMIKAERERRLGLGFDYDFGDGRGVHRIGTTRQDLLGWDEVTDLANALRATGQTAATIDVMTDTGPCQVTPDEWSAIQIAAAAFRQPIWAASFAIALAVEAAVAADDRTTLDAIDERNHPAWTQPNIG